MRLPYRIWLLAAIRPGIPTKSTQRSATRRCHRFREGSGFADDRVAQYANPFDLDLHNVARLHPYRRFASRADATRRTGHDDIAGTKRHNGRLVGDLPCNPVDHYLCGGALHFPAVQPRDERHDDAIRNFFCSRHPRYARNSCRAPIVACVSASRGSMHRCSRHNRQYVSMRRTRRCGAPRGRS